VALAWTAAVAASLVWNILQMRQGVMEGSRLQAEITYQKDILYRRWAGQHGGVYVPVTEETPPNPYLSSVPERDIRTPSGKLLTLMNPAYMTRQIYEFTKRVYEVQGHITSLKPIRPQNAPDPWEAKALEALERGQKEITSIEQIEGRDYFRLMRPFVTERGCLKCHAAQGYREGQIRGGISVSIPMEPLWAIMHKQARRFALAHALLWPIGLAAIFWGAQRLGKDERARRQAEEALRKSEEKHRELAELLPQSVFEMDGTGRLTFANRQALETFGYTKEDFQHGLTVLQMIAPEDRNTAQERISLIMSSQQGSSHEYTAQRKDGSTFPALVYSNPIIEDGRLVGLRGILVDLTERNQAEMQRERLIRELQTALDSVKTLRGLIPICSNCKKIRDDKGYWQQVETYVRDHSEATFTHGLCPECVKILFPEIAKKHER
jgi:PAS domain S-box-containing protein